MSVKNKKTKPGKNKTTPIIIVLFLVVIGGGLLAWRTVLAGGQAVDRTVPTFAAKRGPLTISVLESGTIKARDQKILKNEVEGRTSIIFLIKEGTRVKKGDKLVELDASGLVDEKIDQEIRVQNAEASYISARENLAVVKNQAESDKDIAELNLHFAEKDLEKYVQGEYPKQLLAAEQEIDLYKQELEVAAQRLDWSKKLVAEEYISDAEFREDDLKYKRAQQNVELAQTDLNLLKEYTHERQIMQLESDLRQATMAKERTERKALADVAQAEADFKAKEAELSRQKDKLAKLERQISKAIIYAPADGMAIYATTANRERRRGGSQEPLDEGQEVYERQELIYLPVGNKTAVDVDIHEASLKKVQLGLPAIITVDALPGRQFLGHLDSIAPLPDSQSMWMNPDLKVYPAVVNIDDEDPALRSGMGCKVELIVAQYEDAIYVPVQSVVTESGQTRVYVLEDGVPTRRTVKIGLDNNRMIRIEEGLDEGELVLLEPPLKNASMDKRDDLNEGADQKTNVGDDFQSRVRQSLEESKNKPRPAQSSQDSAPAAKPGAEDRPAMSPAQREAMRKTFENLSEAEKQKFRQQRQQGGGQRPGGGRGGQ